MPTNITLKETLDLLDGKFFSVREGVTQGAYAFWLGSGISRERVIGLDGVLAKLIEFLRSRATVAPTCRFRLALDAVIALAAPSATERSQIDYARPAPTWPCFVDLIRRLWGQYSAVLSIEISGEALDYLLWVGLDFPNTFGHQNPDAEHLAIGMLALEGTITELATANWDGLLEAAMRELGYPQTFYQITITGQDLRGPAAAAVLYKFHGCALRAIADETAYRNLLVARSAQIVGWMSDVRFKIVRDQLGALIQRMRTLMIGLSAQDANIQNLFGQAGAQQGWKWDDKTTPIVFSAQQLGNDQKTVLSVAYGADYEPNRHSICDAACLPAYAKPLLLALLLAVLTTKLQILASDVSATGLDNVARSRIAEGLKHLRNKSAIAGDKDRLAFAKSIAAAVSRTRHQLQDGSCPKGALSYYPLDDAPAHLMKGKQALAVTGQREAASALGLIGLDDESNSWSVSIGDSSDPQAGALKLTSTTASARVFFAANDDTITNLIECGAFGEDEPDVVVICSKRVSSRQQRSPSASLRSGKIGPRYLAYGPMAESATDFDSLRETFRAEVAI